MQFVKRETIISFLKSLNCFKKKEIFFQEKDNENLLSLLLYYIKLLKTGFPNDSNLFIEIRYQ
jgi:hypothetical protein